MPNTDKIIWTLIRSSSSDSASTQKKFNKLVEAKIEDFAQFGPASDCPDLKELVENFCCMHLAVNLRKAFFDTKESSSDKSALSDVLVHEFCKLRSHNGTKQGRPEYCHGASAFPDFVALKSDSSQSSTEARYYQHCKQIKMDRQFGSRYFVTAANSGKVLFLWEAAIDFLSFIGKENGNKLEQTV